MFGDPVLNNKKFSTLSGEDFFKLSNGKAVPEEKRHEVGIPAYGGNGISWYMVIVFFQICNDRIINGVTFIEKVQEISPQIP